MSHEINTQLLDQIADLMPDLSPETRQKLYDMTEANDLEGLWAWQSEHYGKITPEAVCSHPSQYEKDGDDMHCTQCDKYMGNRAHWE